MMLERLLKALFPSGKRKAAEAASAPLPTPGALEAWALARGLEYREREGSTAFTLTGKTGALAWRLEHGAPSRNFIHGTELRGRTELGLHQDVAVLVLNRHLKEALENRAFAQFTDTLRTVADAQLPEEMRWLSMYDEVQLLDAPIGFHDMYAVLADEAKHARAWLDVELCSELMRWPASVTEQTPLILMTLRSNVYLRMETPGPDLDLLAHAVRLYPAACIRARELLPRSAGL